MSAVQEAIGQRERALQRLIRWPWHWPLLQMPTSLIVYVLAIIASDLALIGWELAGTAIHAGDLLLVRLPAGGRGDLHRGAAAARHARGCPPRPALRLVAARRPAPSTALRASGAHSPLYFSAAEAGARDGSRLPEGLQLGRARPGRRRQRSATFHLAVPSTDFFSATGSRAGVTRAPILVAAVGCAVVFTVVNSFAVAIAAHIADPDTAGREVLWNRENLLLDLSELCLGVLVSITCGLSNLLLLASRCPRSCCSSAACSTQQLGRAARTDLKTGLLNAAAWQREADTEIVRATARGDARTADRRHRPLQAGQRHLRPPDRRPGPARGGRHHRQPAPRLGRGGPVRR